MYLLCGRDAGVLYVGKAINLRRRLGSYRSAQPERLPRKLSRLLALVERIHWDECPDEAAALARERELLLALQPRFNTAGVRPARARAVGWQAGADFFKLGWADDPGAWPHVTPPASGLQAGLAALLRLAWAAAQPGRPLADMPSPLIHGPPARPCRFTGGTAAPWRDLAARLGPFFGGRDPDLPVWLADRHPPAGGFEAAWQAADVATLAEAPDCISEPAGVSGLAGPAFT